MPTDFYARVARIGQQRSARVIIDTSGEALRAAIREGVYVLKPNLQELSDLAGRDLLDKTQQEEAALCRREDTERLYARLRAAAA